MHPAFRFFLNTFFLGTVNIQEIARAATGEPGKRSNKSYRNTMSKSRSRSKISGRTSKNRKNSNDMNNGSYVQSNDASIRFGQTVETSGIVASIDVLPDDVNTPPTLSDNGEIPMTANSILRVYVQN